MRVSLARNPFSFLFVSSKREQFVGRYVIRECARGRPLADVLADPYVRNRSTPEERARLLEQPEIVEAIGEQTVAELKRSLARDQALVGAKT